LIVPDKVPVKLVKVQAAVAVCPVATVAITDPELYPLAEQLMV
jgi:hypothetical protein